MTDPVILPVALAVLAVVLPGVWRACDHRAATARFDSAAEEPAAPVTTHADLDSFLRAVSRAARAGATAAGSVLAAPACSAAVSLAQEQLRAGAPFRRVLDPADTALRTVALCTHHGTVSADAVEHAVSVNAQEQSIRAEAHAAAAAARRSAHVLTLLPFGILMLGSAVSGPVRSALATPSALVAIAAGVVLNRAGRSWITRTTARMAAGLSSMDSALWVSSGIAAHLRAGGTLVSAVEQMSAWEPACAAAARGLAAGMPLADALGALDAAAPGLARGLVNGSNDGLPLAPVADAHVKSVLDARSAAARERVAELPVRNTAPLVLLVLPSFLLLAVTPVAIAALRGLSSPRL